MTLSMFENILLHSMKLLSLDAIECDHNYIKLSLFSRRAKLGQIQGGVAEGQPRFDKGIQ